MSRLSKLFAIALALIMVAAACGGGSDSSETSETTSGADEQQIEADREAGDAEGADEREAETGPVRGGTLRYGIEADSSNPFTHYGTSCAVSCRMIFRVVTDGLFITDDNGEIQPYLVETVEPNEDFTVWTMTIRDGIKFHDGTPLDGAAVKYNIDTCRFSPLTGPAFLGLDDVAADGQTVTMTYAAPEAIGPKTLRNETCGMMFSPTWLATLATNPLLQTDEERAAAEGDSSQPVGVGPFKFESYEPGNGGSFVAVRNEDYWRGDGPDSTGEGLPYLDKVEMTVAVDIQSRSNGLRSGEFDIIHTANADEIARYEGDEDFFLIQANDFGETNHILLNSAVGENPTLAFVRGLDGPLDMDPTGQNAVNPMVHLSCRKSLAQALDLDRLVESRYAGIVTPANGPFPPGSVGYLEDSGYPKFDLEAAAESFEQCKTDHGTVPVGFAFNTTNDAFNVETNELIAAMWTEAFGEEIQVGITPIEQGVYIDLALAGAFQAQGWRNHAGVDPTEQWYWWSSATASPIDPSVPELALNFGRFQDPAMDQAFGIIRQNPDQAARVEAAEQVNRQFAENVWNIWTVWTLWGIVANPRVQDITSLNMPDGSATKPVIAGKHHLSQIWCEADDSGAGNCQG